MHSQNGGIMLYESNKRGVGWTRNLGGGIQFVPFDP